MKITKFGHCCLLIEENDTRILTDPGIYSVIQNEVINIDFILITHEHSDHFHVSSLKEVIVNNPNVKIITNSSVGKFLEKERIHFEVIEDGHSFTDKDILIEAFGQKHAVIHQEIDSVQNTGYLINNKLFYPGDALTKPNRHVEVLALPVAGPWIKIGEAIDYALDLNPTKCFPVHDGILINFGMAHGAPQTILPKSNINFEVLELGKEYEF